MSPAHWHAPFEYTYWRWPGMLTGLPCSSDGDNTCRHCPHGFRWVTPLPVFFSRKRQIMWQQTTKTHDDKWWINMMYYNQVSSMSSPPCFSNIPSRGHIALGDVANNRQITTVHSPHMYRSMRRPWQQMMTVICLLISITWFMDYSQGHSHPLEIHQRLRCLHIHWSKVHPWRPSHFLQGTRTPWHRLRGRRLQRWIIAHTHHSMSLIPHCGHLGAHPIP